ncbi:MAG: sigma-70 family RNA polymerase sigma factor [Acidobacteria bacterium]|nr:sigma-70 family RNA polymerase sigma factor [Acidobacteriota bacterium]
MAERICPGATPAEALVALRKLHLEDLALAQACARGNERAWEAFLSRFREKLYSMAYAIARNDARGRELADGVYAELYGISTREGRRVSKLASYTGRGSLEGWLRTVLAQEFINRYRAESRLVSLHEQEEQGAQFTSAQPERSHVPDTRLAFAVDASLGELNAEERFMLAAYFLDGQTLNQIGRALGIHESSVSRRLDKLVLCLRKRVIGHLHAAGMSRRQAQEALEVDVRDVMVDVRSRLQQRRQKGTPGP